MPTAARDRPATLAIAAALAALVAWSFQLRWGVLASSPFPLGVDGYYYPIQLRALLAHGSLAYPASPLAFWWMAPFAAVAGPIAGAKLGAALGGALIALPAYAVGARLGRGRAAGLVAAALASCSATSTYLSVEFVKQGIGLTVALTALWLVLRALDQPTRGRLVGAALVVIAAGLAHRLAGALVIAFSLPAAIEEARGRGRLRGRRLLYALAATGTIAVAIAATRLRLVGALLTSHARWSAPALARPPLAFGHEALAGAAVAALAAAALVVHRDRPRGERVIAWLAIASALVIALPWLDVADPQGLAFRLRVSAFVPLALCAAIVTGALRPLVARALGDERAAAAAATGLAVLAATILAILPRDRREGLVVAHPALVAASLGLAGRVPAGTTVIVPERHVEYMIAWYARVPVSLRPESVAHDRRIRVLLPMSSASTEFPLGPALDAARHEPLLDPPLGLHPRARDGFVLVTERTWDWMLAHMPPRERAHWAAWPTI